MKRIIIALIFVLPVALCILGVGSVIGQAVIEGGYGHGYRTISTR